MTKTEKIELAIVIMGLISLVIFLIAGCDSKSVAGTFDANDPNVTCENLVDIYTGHVAPTPICGNTETHKVEWYPMQEDIGTYTYTFEDKTVAFVVVNDFNDFNNDPNNAPPNIIATIIYRVPPANFNNVSPIIFAKGKHD